MSWISKATLAEIRTRLTPIRAWLAPRIAQGRQWLSAEREPLTWAAPTLKLPSTNAGRLVVLGGIVVLLLLVLPWYAKGHKGENGVVTYPNATLINPILGGLGALFLIYAAIRQARTASEQAETARKQAQIAADRHAAQTTADLQRRITETFSKAAEQLGSANVEVRVGGIYTLERLAGEALASPEEPASGPDLYWTVMETLTALVRERARWHAPGSAAAGMSDKADDLGPEEPEEAQPRFELATDIAAVMAVIQRRPEAGREREQQRGWCFNLRGTDLCGADLRGACLEGADFIGAHLEGADLREAYLDRAVLARARFEGARLRHARLEGASLRGANFRGADLRGAHLDSADLIGAHLENTFLRGAHLEGTLLLAGAHFEGADLRGAHLAGADLVGAQGDARTQLPEGVARPGHWPAYDPAVR